LEALGPLAHPLGVPQRPPTPRQPRWGWLLAYRLCQGNVVGGGISRLPMGVDEGGEPLGPEPGVLAQSPALCHTHRNETLGLLGDPGDGGYAGSYVSKGGTKGTGPPMAPTSTQGYQGLGRPLGQAMEGSKGVGAYPGGGPGGAPVTHKGESVSMRVDTSLASCQGTHVLCGMQPTNLPKAPAAPPFGPAT